MPSTGKRPYLDHSIDTLEDLFRRHPQDAAILQALQAELRHRSTARADRLREQVTRASRSEKPTQPDLLDTVATSPVRQSPPVMKMGFQPKIKVKSAQGLARVQGDVKLPPMLDLGGVNSNERVKGPNSPKGILSSWIALEALSPSTYKAPKDLVGGDQRCVADIVNEELPWLTGEKSRPDHQLYYQIVLGSIPMGKATADLVAAFGADEERSDRVREKAAIAAVLIDRHGVPVDENGIAISSFAWALPLALQRELGTMGAWTRVEDRILEALGKILTKVDDEGKPLPLDAERLLVAHRWLVAQLKLPEHLVEAPSFALRTFHYIKSKNPPEALLLNSFYINDLCKSAQVVGAPTAPTGLKKFVGIEHPARPTDLLNDRVLIEKAIAPSMMPAARWPSPGGHPLVLLQQVAVNLIRSELADKEGIAAVNGPPGTGKTTLLRDVVASAVLDRALAMSTFNDPESAFKASGQKVKTSGAGYYHIYTLDPRLKGHEILVASSNNKAVENVSRELPAAKAVGAPKEKLSYFRSIADLVHSSHVVEDADTDASSSGVETWGLIAAVLGNAKNRSSFSKTFWWDKERGFLVYLKAARGDDVRIEEKDSKTGELRRRLPVVVDLERPPKSQLEAKANWRAARDSFVKLHNEVQQDLKRLEKVREAVHQSARTDRALREANGKLGTLEEQVRNVKRRWNGTPDRRAKGTPLPDGGCARAS